MKKVFILIAILATYTTYGQDANTDSRISIGVNFSPDYNYRTIKRNENTSGIDQAIESRNDREVAKIGYTTGLNMAIIISKNMAFETGLQYSDKGYQTKKSDLNFDPIPDPDNQPLMSTVKFDYSYQYLGVPLKINFSLGEGDLRIISGIGVTTNFLLNAQRSTIIANPDGKKKTTKNNKTFEYNLIDLSPMISFGFDYRLNNFIRFRAEPTFRYGIIKTENAPIKENLWNAGVNVGLSYDI